MAPRAVGALFALVAAVVLLASLGAGLAPKVVPGWWDGHPRVDGKTIERKEIHVGLLAGHGCNLGETVTCQELPTGSMLAPIGIGEMAAIGVTLASLVALMIAAWTIGKRRKWLAKLVLGETIVIAIGGAVLLFLGPQIKATQHVDVPIGLGMILFWAGVGSASIAAVIAMRLEREPLRLRASAPAVNPPSPQPAQPATFDFNQLLRDDQLHAPVPSPGGHLAGPAGPLSPMQMMPPPQPTPPPRFDPGPPPQPLMYDSIAPPRPPPTTIEAAIPTPPPPRPSSPSVPPPRPSSPSVPPALTGPARAKAASPPPSLAPPAPGRPARATNSPPSKYPTLAHAIPPPPTPANLMAPTVLPARDSALKIPVDPTERSTAVRDVAEPVTAVEIDAEAKARHAAAGKVPLPGMPSVKPTPTPAPRDSMLDATVERPREPNESPAESRDSAATIARPRVSAPVIEPPASPVDEPRDSAATIARPRVSAPDLDEATRQSAPIVDKPEDLGATIERNPAPPKSEPDPDPEPPARASQVPISTAPASLPPPRKTTTQAAGPTPACPQCEAPMAWVEEHLRFYCPQCRMYF